MSLKIKELSNLIEIIENKTNYNIFLLEKGEYNLTSNFTINRDNVQLIGMGNSQNTKIIQNNITENGLNINANNIKIQNITFYVLHDKHAIYGKNVNNLKIKNCYFYNSSTTYSIYMENDLNNNPIQEYENDIFSIQFNILNSVIYNDTGKSIYVKKFKNVNINKNIIKRGGITVSLCKNSYILYNNIYDINNDAITIETPSENIQITHNKIHDIGRSGIKIIRLNGQLSNYISKIFIIKNIIKYTQLHSIEINDVDEINISENILISIFDPSVYILRSKYINLNKNFISDFNFAMQFILCQNIIIEQNNLVSTYPIICEHFINIENCNLISLVSNKYIGNHSSSIYKYIGNNTDIIDENNIVNEVVSINDEVFKANNL